jgi:hypothetical protein
VVRGWRVVRDTPVVARGVIDGDGVSCGMCFPGL